MFSAVLSHITKWKIKVLTKAPKSRPQSHLLLNLCLHLSLCLCSLPMVTPDVLGFPWERHAILSLCLLFPLQVAFPLPISTWLTSIPIPSLCSSIFERHAFSILLKLQSGLFLYLVCLHTYYITLNICVRQPAWTHTHLPRHTRMQAL